MVFHRVIGAEIRVYLCFIMENDDAKKQDMVKKYNISRASLYRILNNGNCCLKRNVCEADIQGSGRSRKLSERNERSLLRQIDVLQRQEGSFTIKRLMFEAGIDARTVSCKTVRRLLHRHGYKYIQACRKGILTMADHERRLKFARRIKREYTCSLWTEQVAFYLDGVSFAHKYKPADQARSTHGRIWRKPEEGPRTGCTAKGSHCGSDGRMARFMVAISYREGVVLCEQYDTLDGHYFKDLVEREFGNMFEKNKQRGLQALDSRRRSEPKQRFSTLLLPCTGSPTTFHPSKEPT